MNNLQKIEHLLIVEDCQGKRTIVLKSATCSIGRDPSNSIVLHSSKISRHHAMLLRLTIPNTTHHQFRIIDGDLQGKRSTNGISVNGHSCSSHNLQHGDEIIFGSEVRARYYATTSQADINFLTSDHAEDVTGFLGNIHNPFKTLNFNLTDRDKVLATQTTLERLASFPELLSHPVVEIDLAGNITYLNPAAIEEFPNIQKVRQQHPIIAQMISRVKNSQATYLTCETEIAERVFEQSIHYIAASEIIRCYIVDITKRKQVEAALQESERRFRAIFNSMFQFMGLLKPDGILLEINQTALDFAGLKAEDIIGRPFWQGSWWSLSTSIQEQLQKAIALAAQGQFIRYEVDVRGIDNTIATIDFSLKPVFDDFGEVVLLISEGRNITEKKEAEKALRQSEERFRLLVNCSPVGIFQTDSKGNFLFVNIRWLQMTGLTFSQALSKGWIKALHPEDRQRVLTQWDKTIQARQEFSMEYRYQSTEGKTIWVFTNAIAIYNEKKEITGYFGTVTDISEQQAALRERQQVEVLLKQANEDLEVRVKKRTAELDSINQSLKAEIIERQRAEEELRLIQTTTQAVTKAANFEGAIKIILQKICETIDWNFAEAWIPEPKNELLNLSPACYLSDEKLSLFRNTSEKFTFAWDIGIPGRIWASKQTEWIPNVAIESNPIFLRTEIAKQMGLKATLGVPLIANQEVIAVLVFFSFESYQEDRRVVELVQSVIARLSLVIERKRAEDALLSSMATNRALINAIPDLILRINSEGIFVNYKAAKEKNILMPNTNLLGKHIDEIFPEEISLQTMNAIERALDSREAQIMECQLSNNHELNHYEVRIVATVEDEVMAIVRDITERKRMEADIRNALEKEKYLNELKSRFVAMTSHEFRTPLTTILSSAELLEYHGHKWSEEKKLSHLQRIQGSVKHMTSLLNDVLLLGKAEAGKLELKPTALDLPKFCQELVEEIQHGMSSHQIIFNTHLSNLIVYLDEKLLRHILINLLTNAVKYSPDRDQIDFELICQAQAAIFRIQDHGIGIPPEDRDKLFDSFHRANNVGSISGTGLGLAIVKRSVDLHGGTITLESQIDIGTTFIVTIPFSVVK